MVLQKFTFDSRFQSPQDLRSSEWFPPMGLGMGAYPSKWLILPCYCLWALEGIWFHDDWGAHLRVDGWCNCMDFLKHVREGYFKPSFAQNQRYVSGLPFFFSNVQGDVSHAVQMNSFPYATWEEPWHIMMYHIFASKRRSHSINAACLMPICTMQQDTSRKRSPASGH